MLDDCVPWPEDVADGYRARGIWRGETLGDLLRRWAAEYRDRTALIDAAGDRLSYSALDGWSDRLAAGFQAKGIAPGDRVLVQLPNRPEFVAVCFALFRLGAVPVFALPSFRSNEIGHLARLSGAQTYVIPDEFNGFDHRVLARDALKECPELERIVVAGDPGEFTALADVEAEPADLPGPQASDIAFFLLSGGTTALPKLIPRTHEGYAHQLEVTSEVCATTGDSVYLAVLPIEFNFPWGCPGVLGTLSRGGTAVFAETAHPETCFALVERHRVTITSIVPTIVHLWLSAVSDTRHDLSSLKLVQVSSAKLHPELASRIEPAFGAQLQQVYGMSEGMLTFTRLDDPPETVLETQGRPLSPADEIRVVDSAGREVPQGEVGELLARGPYTLRGYYRAREHNRIAFTADGFYRSGDLVRLTERGDVVVEGRIKDIISRGGNKISAPEVEEHLTAHPGVEQAAVVPAPDEILGERVHAYVVPASGSPAPRLPELRRLLRSRGLADHKLPDQVEAVDSLPMTGLNKVDKKVLIARVSDQRTG